MLSCNCAREVVTIVLQLSLPCTRHKDKEQKKEHRIAAPRSRIGLCDDCKDQIRATDDGMIAGADIDPDCTGH